MAALDETWLAELLEERSPDRPAAVAIRGALRLDLDHRCEHGPGRFPWYSIAKTVIAACLVQLADEGALGLDDPLSSWHPAVPGAERCSLRQVLGHRAGLRDYGGLPAYHEALAASPGQAWAREAYAHATWEQGLLFEPGTAFAYSNPGYRLLVEVLEEVTGRDLDEIARVRIADRLGLESFGPLSVAGDFAGLEQGLSVRLHPDGSVQDVRTTMDPGWVFHRSFAATAGDAAHFMHALAEGELVSEQGLRAMTALVPIGRANPPWHEPSYGLGVMGDPASASGLLLGHNGGGPGYTASAFHAPASAGSAVTVCVLAATEQDAFAEGLLREILAQFAA